MDSLVDADSLVEGNVDMSKIRSKKEYKCSYAKCGKKYNLKEFERYTLDFCCAKCMRSFSELVNFLHSETRKKERDNKYIYEENII